MRRSPLLAAGAAGALLLARSRRRAGADPVASTPWPALTGRSATVVADDGVVLHADVHGPDDAAATVVLAHGYLCDRTLWDLQVAALLAARPDLRVVAYDQRGHGRSGPTAQERATIAQLGTDLAAVLAALAPTGPVVLAGHSMGGMTLLALAEQNPELFGPRVVGVGLVATSSGQLSSVTYGMPVLVNRLFRRLHPRLLAKALEVEQAGGTPRPTPAGTLRWLNFGPGADPTHVRRTVEVLRAASAATSAHFYPTFSDHDRHAALAAMRGVAVTVLVGDRDRLCPVEHSRRMAGEVPGSRLVVYPGAGHMVMLQRADEVSAQLVELCDALPRPADRRRARAGV